MKTMFNKDEAINYILDTKLDDEVLQFLTNNPNEYFSIRRISELMSINIKIVTRRINRLRKIRALDIRLISIRKSNDKSSYIVNTYKLKNE